MNTHNGRLISGGRLQLPSDVHGNSGSQTVMRVVDGKLHVRPHRDVLKHIQAMLRPFAPADWSVTDELIADRRAEAARD